MTKWIIALALATLAALALRALPAVASGILYQQASCCAVGATPVPTPTPH